MSKAPHTSKDGSDWTEKLIAQGWAVVPEAVIRELDRRFPNGAAAAAIKDAEEIKARGNIYRFWLTPKGEVSVQEGLSITQGVGHG